MELNGIITHGTMISLMGKQRWFLIKTYVRVKHRSSITLGYHQKGKGAIIYAGKKMLGTIHKVENKALIWREYNET